MGDKTGIEWTDATWNPVSGCSKVSQGCKNCYAERMFPRPYPGRAFTDVRTHPERLEQPLRWRRPRRIFVNSMSDLFHEDVHDRFIAAVFGIMACAPQHTFQILTKRPERMREWFRAIHSQTPFYQMSRALHDQPIDFPRDLQLPHTWPLPNVWLGVSAEDQPTFDERWRYLRDTPAAVRFVSLEPLLGEVDIRQAIHVIPVFNSKAYAQGGEIVGISAPTMHWEQSYNIHTREPIKSEIDWVITGGESGPRARPSHPDWFRSLRDQCQAAGVPFFFKQWGEWAPAYGSTRGQRAIFHGDAAAEIEPGRKLRVFEQLDACIMQRVGKKSAGNVLDGRTHLEFPR